LVGCDKEGWTGYDKIHIDIFNDRVNKPLKFSDLVKMTSDKSEVLVYYEWRYLYLVKE
jgi:hypothetical protein